MAPTTSSPLRGVIFPRAGELGSGPVPGSGGSDGSDGMDGSDGIRTPPHAASPTTVLSSTSGLSERINMTFGDNRAII